MKQLIIILCHILFLINGLLMQLKATPEFETKRISNTYNLLPINIQLQINELPTTENCYRISSADIVKASHIKVCFNSDKQLSHIGFQLFDTNIVKGEFEDAYYFIENSLLYFALLSTSEAEMKEAKNRKIDFIKNNRHISSFSAKKRIIPFEYLFQDYEFHLRHSSNSFICEFIFSNKEQFAMKFPAGIEIIKAMDKEELETYFIRKMKTFHSRKTTNTEEKICYYSTNVLPSGLFVQHGSKFETDDFRSDVFLKKEEIFQPVFSSEFPVESFSNIFTCNLETSLNANITVMLYGNKKENCLIEMNKLLLFLSENQQTYFGLQNYDETSAKIKATIIYNNSAYQFLHLLVVETDKNILFEKTEKNDIKITLYPYIPYSNFISGFNNK